MWHENILSAKRMGCSELEEREAREKESTEMTERINREEIEVCL